MDFHGATNQSPESVLLQGQNAFPISRAGQLTVSLVETTAMYLTDRYCAPILKAFMALPPNSQFKAVYPLVCLNLGATPEQAAKGIALCPEKGVLMDIKGKIRSWVEERSPHSRQHYFRGGRIATWGPNARPLLFVNPVLGENNAAGQWHPYIRVRGRGWSFDPSAAEAAPQPSVAVQQAAAALYRKRGMQGRGRVAHAMNVQVTQLRYTVRGQGSVVVC
jgi:hypothetical protein